MLIQVLQKVFRKPRYMLLAFGTSMLVFVFAVWFPNMSLIVKIMGHSKISFLQKIDVPISLLGSIVTNFTLLSASYTIAIALLFGVNLSMIIYFVRRRITEVTQDGIVTGIFGIGSGVIGMGCAACGSFFLTSIVSVFGASGVLLYLPLGGGEFGIMGVMLLAISLYLTAKKIQNPMVCSIDP